MPVTENIRYKHIWSPQGGRKSDMISYDLWNSLDYGPAVVQRNCAQSVNWKADRLALLPYNTPFSRFRFLCLWLGMGRGCNSDQACAISQTIFKSGDWGSDLTAISHLANNREPYKCIFVVPDQPWRQLTLDSHLAVIYFHCAKLGGNERCVIGFSL